MDALRINEPFGNNFRSPRSDPTAPFPLFRAKYRSCNSFLPELPHSIRRSFDHRNKHFLSRATRARNRATPSSRLNAIPNISRKFVEQKRDRLLYVINIDSRST